MNNPGIPCVCRHYPPFVICLYTLCLLGLPRGFQDSCNSSFSENEADVFVISLLETACLSSRV